MTRLIRFLIIFLCLYALPAMADTLCLPDDLHTIEKEAFFGDQSLDEVILPESITTIGPLAFANSSVKRIYLPASLVDIAEDAFVQCQQVIGYGENGTVASTFFCNHANLSFEGEPEWSAAYRKFVIDQEFYDLESPIFYHPDPFEAELEPMLYGLYDFDRDEIPELLIHNGDLSMGGRTNRVFTFRDSEIIYIGDAGTRMCVLNYFPNSSYSGLFCCDGNTDYYYTHYFPKNGDQLSWITVMVEIYEYDESDIYNPPTVTITINQLDDDDALFALAKDLKNAERLKQFSYDEILQMGWTAFVDAALPKNN